MRTLHLPLGDPRSRRGACNAFRLRPSAQSPKARERPNYTKLVCRCGRTPQWRRGTLRRASPKAARAASRSAYKVSEHLRRRAPDDSRRTRRVRGRTLARGGDGRRLQSTGGPPRAPCARGGSRRGRAVAAFGRIGKRRFAEHGPCVGRAAGIERVRSAAEPPQRPHAADYRRRKTARAAFGVRRGDLDSIEHLVRLAASAMAVELSREQGNQPGRRRAFWERLMTQTYVDAAAARDDAAARGITPATHYVAIALEAEVSEEQTAAACRNALRDAALQAYRAANADSGLLERGSTLFFFVPAAREIDAANARTATALLARTLPKKHPNLRVGGGVGSRVPFTDLHRSAGQARDALAISRRVYGAGRIGVHDELGAYPLLLAGADAAQLREFAARTLAPLRVYDEKHQTELERTLRLYFCVGENVKTAAEQLNVHRHTVFYRLRQIGDICGCKFDDPHDQLTLRMAIAIDALTT